MHCGVLFVAYMNYILLLEMVQTNKILIYNIPFSLPVKLLLCAQSA